MHQRRFRSQVSRRLVMVPSSSIFVNDCRLSPSVCTPWYTGHFHKPVLPAAPSPVRHLSWCKQFARVPTGSEEARSKKYKSLHPVSPFCLIINNGLPFLPCFFFHHHCSESLIDYDSIFVSILKSFQELAVCLNCPSHSVVHRQLRVTTRLSSCSW